MSRQWLWAGALRIAVVLAGCASAPLKPTVEAQGLAADAPAECAAPPPSGDAAVRLARALGYGTLGVFLGALQGASDAANWARWNGGAWSDRAWIAAAAGAGVGFLIGFAAGLAEAGRGWSPEPAAPPPCPAALAKTTVSAEDNMQREGTK